MSKTLEQVLLTIGKTTPDVAQLLTAEIQKRDFQIKDKEVQLQDKEVQLQDKEIALQEAIQAYESEVEKRLAYQRMIFGRKTERMVYEDEYGEALPLFDIEPDQAEVDEKDLEDMTCSCPKKSKKNKTKKAAISERMVVIPVPEEDRVCECGCEKQFVRHEKKRLLHFIPARYEVEIQAREILACPKGCEKSIVTAPKVAHILQKTKATESLLAYVCISKVLDRQPLYHLEKKIEREDGWHIQRKTMARWMILLSEKLQPLINLMKEEILDYDVSAIDATILQVLNEPQRPAHLKSQAYCIRGGPPGKEVTMYEYNAYKQQEYVTDFFTDYTGFISSDASPVFNEIAAKEGITQSVCHAHARRKFEQIEKRRLSAKKKKRAKPGLAYHVLKHVYKPLYQIEADMKERTYTPEQVVEYRQEKAKPILDAHKKWLDRHRELTLGQSPIRKAIDYSLNHWKGLMVYLADGRIPIDNNATERDIKPFVMGRKNFMFAATQAGADALGVHFSLIITAKHHGLDPMAYYTDIFKRIPTCKTFDDYAQLLPWHWSASS